MSWRRLFASVSAVVIAVPLCHVGAQERSATNIRDDSNAFGQMLSEAFEELLGDLDAKTEMEKTLVAKALKRKVLGTPSSTTITLLRPSLVDVDMVTASSRNSDTGNLVKLVTVWTPRVTESTAIIVNADVVEGKIHVDERILRWGGQGSWEILFGGVEEH